MYSFNILLDFYLIHEMCQPSKRAFTLLIKFILITPYNAVIFFKTLLPREILCHLKLICIRPKDSKAKSAA